MEIDVTKYATSKNITAGVTEAVNEMQSGDTLVFPKGEYHFYKDYCQSRVIHMTNTDSFEFPKKYFAMLIENKSDIIIDGNDSVFVMHGDICALTLLSCNNVRLKNFTVRYAAPTNVELTVKEIKGNKITYKIPQGNTWYIDGKDAVFFEQSPYTKKNYWQFKNNENSWCAVLHKGKFVCRTINQPFLGKVGLKRLSSDELQIKYLFKKKYEVGSTYALSQNKCRSSCGLFFYQSKNIECSNINVNYMHGFGWLTQMCENVSFDTVRFEPDKEHTVSSFADCIHVCGCKGKVNIKNCYFTQPHDDGINIHGAFLRVKRKVDDFTLELEFVHNQQGGYKAFYGGDKVLFYYRNNLQQCGENYTVKAVTDDINSKTCTVTFNEKLPSDIECKYKAQNNVVAENMSYCPDVEISDCVFTAIPTRGILCTSSGHVAIHNNHFDNTQMANIYISNDANDWYESGPVRDMQIYDNVFDVPKSAQKEWKVTGAIYVDPVTLGGKVTMPIHKNIKIYNNTFNLQSGYALYSKGAENITIDETKEKVVIE